MTVINREALERMLEAHLTQELIDREINTPLSLNLKVADVAFISKLVINYVPFWTALTARSSLERQVKIASDNLRTLGREQMLNAEIDAISSVIDMLKIFET